MVIVKYLVAPTQTHPQYWKVGKAYAVVFVKTVDQKAAEVSAHDFLHQSHWQIEALEECGYGSHSLDSSLDEEQRSWLRQAENAGIWAVYFPCEPGGELSDDKLP